MPRGAGPVTQACELGLEKRKGMVGPVLVNGDIHVLLNIHIQRGKITKC